MTDFDGLQQRADDTIEAVGESYKTFPASAIKMGLEMFTDILIAGIRELRDIRELLEEARDERSERDA